MRARERSKAPIHSEAEPLNDEQSYYLPPRKVIHPSEKGKWTRRFYQTLLWLFILLVAGLTVWGIRFS